VKFPFRRRVPACIHPVTYKYFLEPDAVEGAWGGRACAFGEVRRIAGLGLRQIDNDRFVIRSTAEGNPITVIRTRQCCPADIARLHGILGFREVPC